MLDRSNRLDSITDLRDKNMSKLQETGKDRGPWHAVVHGVAEIDRTKQLKNNTIF